jgi:hypothetical protein
LSAPQTAAEREEQTTEDGFESAWTPQKGIIHCTSRNALPPAIAGASAAFLAKV